jgi:hypothetical protein
MKIGPLENQKKSPKCKNGDFGATQGYIYAEVG